MFILKAMFHQLYSKFIHWALRFLQLQLFISLVSLPILISWGLPISLLSPVGNLIFIPFITLFLLLSTLILFCELLFIPNGLLISFLEMVNSCWMQIITWTPFYPLIGFPKPSTWLLLFIPIATITILTLRIFKGILKTVFSMSLLFLFLYWCTHHQKQSSVLSSLNCGRGKVTLIYDQDKIVIIDPSVIGQTKSAHSWIMYTLMPHITSTTGKTTIDYFILLKPNKTVINALCEVLKEVKIDTIITPQLFMKNKKTASIYSSLQEIVESKNTELIIIDSEQHNIKFGQTIISIVPQEQWIKNGNFFIRSIHAYGSHNNQDFSCQPCKKTIHRKN